MSLRSFLKYSGYSCLTAFGIAAGTFLYGTEIEPRSFRIEPHTIHSEHIAESLSGLNVMVLADLHMGSRFMDLERLRSIVDEINTQRADLVVIPGDLINSGMEFGTNYNFSYEDVVNILSDIESPVIVSFGNHEYLNRRNINPTTLNTHLEENGIPVLINESIEIETRLGSIWVVGIDDTHRGNPDYEQTMQNIPENASIFYLSHNPTGFEELDRPVSLAIAGDTHCGQINFFGFRPAQYIPNHIKTMSKWACGLYNDLPHDNIGFVSHGVGTSTMPIRIGVTPQAELLTIEYNEPNP